MASLFFRYRYWLAVLLVGLGIAERAAWCLTRSTSGAAGEAMRVATAIGEGRGFADAYRVGQGATAHLLPLSPAIAGLVYRLFGVGSPFAEAVLFCWSTGLVMIGYLLLFRTFGRLGVPQWARFGALAYGCLMPSYFGQEAVDFRVWDGALAVSLAALLLDRTVKLELDGGSSRQALIVTGALAALLFFVNPTIGVAYAAVAALATLRRVPARSWRAPIVAGLGGHAMLIVPWTIRNERAVGAAIPLRSNAGLELAIGLYPGGLEAKDRGAAFMARLEAIHPALGDAPFAAMRAAGGEVEYARRLGRSTREWVSAHPGEAMALMFLHMRQTLLPQEWQFAVFGSGGLVGVRAVLSQLAGIAGIVGLFVCLVRRKRGWWCPALALALTVLVAAPFQPVKRYTYLVYPLLLFSAGGMAAWRQSQRLPLVS